MPVAQRDSFKRKLKKEREITHYANLINDIFHLIRFYKVNVDAVIDEVTMVQEVIENTSYKNLRGVK